MSLTSSSFTNLHLDPAILQVLEGLGFLQPTLIQEKSIPVLLAGKDLIGQSKTGSGKTAAFTLPILQKIDLESKNIQALILSPTRELCTQVAREIRKFGRNHPGLNVLILSGGMPKGAQRDSLKKGVHIVVGTPGRLLDHLKGETIDISQISTLVLDEADRMLDMGFKDDMEAILAVVPKKRQTVFFSATFPSSIKSMSRKYQNHPVEITVEDIVEATPEIKQIIYECEERSKVKALLFILQENQPESVLIFCNQKITTTELNEELLDATINSECLHGDLEQNDRDRVMAKFRNKSTLVLIATDVAARGIDVENLGMVVNFDLPQSTDIYTHRIGRTGRAGKIGLAITFATPREKHKVLAIEQHTKIPLEKGDLHGLANIGETIKFETAPMVTLFIAGGRKDKMRAGDILGALTGEAGGLDGNDIGKIEIHDRFSYVAIAKDVAKLALKSLSNGRIKGKKFRVETVK